MENENTPPQFRNIKAHSAEQTLRLPEEIIEEILSRLPVKSLLKFRCVSKSWRSLIGSERFIQTQLENSTKNTSFTHHRIILKSCSPNDRLKQCSLQSLLSEPFTHSFAFDDDPINIPLESICLVGCCNGLVCILIDRKHFILWNPSTRMSKKLPDIDDKIMYGHMTKYGFGCDESSGDYKVFGIISVLITGRYQAIGKVYSLKTNSWKIMKDKDVSPFDEAGKLASGNLHWARICSNSRWDIVSFDLKSEVYGIVEQPIYSEGDFHPLLGVHWGCLCVLCDYRKTRSDVWVMKQYGVKESWDKVVTVPYLYDPWKAPFSSPVCIDSNGEVLLIYGSTFVTYYPDLEDDGAVLLNYGSTFVTYYPEDDAFRHSRIINSDSFREAHIYVESLVSLVPDGEQETQTP